MPMATETKCQCGEPATLECKRCKDWICEDISCGQETVDGYLCGTYTQWGCSRKYTTCDICQEEEAVHEADLEFCDECGNAQCEDCVSEGPGECEKCGVPICKDCDDLHICESIEATEEI